MILKAFWRSIIPALMAAVMFACAPMPPERPPEGRTEPYKVFGKRYYPLKSSTGFQQTGTASWYGSDFHGRKTSNGEIYNMYASTAAHKTLPFGTFIRVTNLDNGKVTLARVNDRGPFVKGRIVDLSRKCAEEIDILEKGIAQVKVAALGMKKRVTENGRVRIAYVQPASYETGNFTIQVGSFLNKDNAYGLKERLADQYENAHIVIYDKGVQTFYRVRITQSKTLQVAMHRRDELESKGFTQAFVVAE